MKPAYLKKEKFLFSSLKPKVVISSLCASVLILGLIGYHFLAAINPSMFNKARIYLNEISLPANVMSLNRFVYDFIEEVAQMTQNGKSNAKKETIDLLSEIQETGYVIRKGKDAEVRPPFVGTQAEMERVMAYLLHSGQVIHLVGIIHTPTPATPLCTQGEINPGLVDPSMSQDDKRLYTVKERPAIVREYLEKGGILYILYPQGGREKRTAQQLAIYDAEKEKHPRNLIDHELDCTTLDKEMVGATYLFNTTNGGWVAFSIMSSQANAPTDDQEWGIWFGSLQHPKVRQRVESVLQYLQDVGGPDISSQLFH